MPPVFTELNEGSAALMAIDFTDPGPGTPVRSDALGARAVSLNIPCVPVCARHMGGNCGQTCVVWCTLVLCLCVCERVSVCVCYTPVYVLSTSR